VGLGVIRRSIDSPLGPLTLTQQDDALVGLAWGDGYGGRSDLLDAAADQLAAYFAARRQDFDLPLRVCGSGAVRAVCAAMAAIPYGQTRSYGALARDLGIPAQAVGQACGANPLPVLIPCHRVTGLQGLGGFSGGAGTETKVWLLRHEGGLLI
jgi:methylated-DNA-[protein]-cysteine S-methyltransferase